MIIRALRLGAADVLEDVERGQGDFPERARLDIGLAAAVVDMALRVVHLGHGHGVIRCGDGLLRGNFFGSETLLVQQSLRVLGLPHQLRHQSLTFRVDRHQVLVCDH